MEMSVKLLVREKYILKERIESLREELHVLLELDEPDTEIILDVSAKLDKVIVEYYLLK